MLTRTPTPDAHSTMKRGAALIGLTLLCAGTLWSEHQIAVLLGLRFLFLAAASGLTGFVVALYRAPEGCEGHDGVHLRRDAHPVVRIRYPRFSRLGRARP